MQISGTARLVVLALLLQAGVLLAGCNGDGDGGGGTYSAAHESAPVATMAGVASPSLEA